MKPTRCYAWVGLWMATLSINAAQAQTVASSKPLLQPGQTTPVMAIGTIQNVSGSAQLRGIMGDEVRDTVKLYLAGKIVQWYVRHDVNGVVFLLNAKSTAEATALLAPLPLVQQKLMRFDFIPVGPLTPLGLLTQNNK